MSSARIGKFSALVPREIDTGERAPFFRSAVPNHDSPISTSAAGTRVGCEGHGGSVTATTPAAATESVCSTESITEHTIAAATNAAHSTVTAATGGTRIRERVTGASTAATAVGQGSQRNECSRASNSTTSRRAGRRRWLTSYC